MITYILKCNRCYTPKTVAKFDSRQQATDAGWYMDDTDDCLCPNCVKELEEEFGETI